MNKQKQKKSIFITGITSGIGSVIFDLCQKNEFDIAAVVRQEDQLNELKNKNYSSLDLYQADLSNKQDVQKLINQIKDMRFDYVLLNAGYALMGAFHELPMESIDKIIEAKQQGKESTDIEKKIDELVYKLYDITADEQKIIEGIQ